MLFFCNSDLRLIVGTIGRQCCLIAKTPPLGHEEAVPDSKHILSRKAETALRTGQMAAAIAAYRDVLAIDPAMPDIWYNLGYALRIDRQFAEALDAYAQALVHGVVQPEEVHLNRAAIFSEQLDAFDDAFAELDAATRINPNFVLGWLNLGLLHEDLGQIAEARKAYDRVLQIEPRNGRALARLAGIAMFSGGTAEIVPKLEAALRSPTLPAEDAIDVAFGLANMYDAKGNYGEAFALATAANHIQSQRASAHLRYDPVAHERLVDALCAMQWPAPLTPTGTGGAVPIFICGLFRSGSTLAEQLLARHSDTKAGGEFDFIPEIVRTGLQPYPLALARADRAALEGLRREYLARLAATGYDGSPVSDKRCDNFLHIGLVKMLFPAAKIIHSTRSPLDNAVSLFFQHFADAIGYSMSLDHLSHWLAQYRRLMIHWQTLYGPDIHDFNYDAAVRNPEPEVRAMVHHCGLAWLDSSEPTSSVVKTASAWQVRQPLHQRSSGRWRNYAAQLETVKRVAGIDDEGNWLLP